MSWLAGPEQWDKLAARLATTNEAGIDSETYNQPDRTSPQWRTKVHVWSIGVLTERRSPRGFRYAQGAVLPVEALWHEPLWQQLRRLNLYAHNSPHDYHSFANIGRELVIKDTLQWARVAVPGMKDYGLKDMEQWALGYPARPGFLEVVTHPVEVVRVTERSEKRCVCGKQPCRARSSSDWWDPNVVVDGVAGWFRQHTREVVRIPTEHRRIVDQRWEVPEFVPGHERWDIWVQYALADAVRGMELVDWLRQRPMKEREYPWHAAKK